MLSPITPEERGPQGVPAPAAGAELVSTIMECSDEEALLLDLSEPAYPAHQLVCRRGACLRDALI